MRRASMESPTEPEEEALASISQLRRTYREAAERVFDEEVEATDPAGLHKETLAMRHLEVIVMVYETMKRTQNPVLLETMADGGLRSANRIAQLLPEWKKYRVDILGLQQQIEERDRAISELTSTIEKMRMTENQVTQQLASRLVVAMENLPTTDSTPTSASKKRARPPTPSTGQSGSSSSSGSEDETEHEQDPVPLQASSPLPSVPHTPSPVDEEALPTTPSLEPEITIMEEDRPVMSDPLCPVCVRPTRNLIAFRCNSCKVFWGRLIARHKEGGSLKTACDPPHEGVGHTCVFCRRTRYELEYVRRYPDKELPIPSVLQVSTAGDGGSRRGGGCKPPGHSASSPEDSGVVTPRKGGKRGQAGAPRTPSIPPSKTTP